MTRPRGPLRLAPGLLDSMARPPLRVTRDAFGHGNGLATAKVNEYAFFYPCRAWLTAPEPNLAVLTPAGHDRKGSDRRRLRIRPQEQLLPPAQEASRARRALAAVPGTPAGPRQRDAPAGIVLWAGTHTGSRHRDKAGQRANRDSP